MSFSSLLVRYLELRDEDIEPDKECISINQAFAIRAERNKEMHNLLNQMDSILYDAN